MPLPLGDVTQAYRSAPEKTEQALTKVRASLHQLRVVKECFNTAIEGRFQGGPDAAVPPWIRGGSVQPAGVTLKPDTVNPFTPI